MMIHQKLNPYLAVLIATIVASIATYALIMECNKIQELETRPAAIGERVSHTAFSGADTENWKTYRNEKYGFEVKYPENYFERINIDPDTLGGNQYFDDAYQNLFFAYVGDVNTLPKGRFTVEMISVPYSASEVEEMVKKRINPYKQDFVGFTYPLYIHDAQPVSHYDVVSIPSYTNGSNKYLCEDEVAVIPRKENESILFSISRCKVTEITESVSDEVAVGSGIVLTAADGEIRDQMLSTFTLIK